jgi:ATP-dependent DNA helicase DinG
VSAADTLREHLWEVCFGAVVTSATLTALGRFERTLDQLGLPADTPAVRLQSPFDHYNRGVLVVPAMRTDPSDPQAHTEEVAEYLGQALPGMTAALVLFTSWRQMLTTLERQSESIKNRVLAQGAYSRQEILRRHRERIDAGEASVIFGLASFAEGVDLPGGYLTDVVITKLPFSVPDDPVDATMAEWIEQRGGNAFADWSVPAASMRLTQAVGRLLRTEQDSGQVVLLDRRVVTRRYGRQLLDALPPFRRQIAN